MGVGTLPFSFPKARAEFSLTYHSSCASPEGAGIIQLLPDPHSKLQLPGIEPTPHSLPSPGSLLLPKTGDLKILAELLICEDSGY